jgi:hypothetical protein
MTASHPSDEVLVAYLREDVGSDEELRLEEHLLECDRCVGSLAAIQPRLTSPPHPPLRVPLEIRARVAPGASGVPAHSTAARSRSRPRPPLLLRWPVLIPASLAAGFVLAVSVQMLRHPRGSEITTRAVDWSASPSLVAVATALRDQPSSDATVLADLRAGDTVTAVERRGEWVRIERSTGVGGWVRTEALRQD